MSSNWTGTVDCEIGSVPPSGYTFLELPRRDERQALVGVVCEEHRDDRGQHRNRAGEHRACERRALSLAHRSLEGWGLVVLAHCRGEVEVRLLPLVRAAPRLVRRFP